MGNEDERRQNVFDKKDDDDDDDNDWARATSIIFPSSISLITITMNNSTRYLIEIARSHNVPFEPDARVMQEDEIALAENQLGQLIDFQGIQDKNPNALPSNGVLPDAGGF